MILNAIAEKLKRQSKDDFKGRHFEAWLIVQAVAWYLRYPLSYRDLEEMFRERSFAVDHSTVNRWVLAYAPMIEKRLRQFRRPPCGSVPIDETYVKIGGKWRYLYRAIDKHGNPVDVLLTAKRDLDAAKRFFRKMLKDEPLLSPGKVDTWRKRMKALRALWFIQTKAGPSGEFHYVFLVNPNVAVEWMKMNGQIQDGLYPRFIDRVMEIGAFGEIEGFREHMELVRQQQAAAEAAKAVEATKTLPLAEAPVETGTSAITQETV